MDEEVQGLSDMIASMNNLPLALGTQKLILVRAAREGMEHTRVRMGELAPIDESQSEHRLKENIITVISEQSATGCVARTGPSRKGFYGYFPEYGTTKQSPQPFARPAWDETQAQVLATIGTLIGNGIEKEMVKR